MSQPAAQQTHIPADDSSIGQASRVATLTLSFWVVKTVLTTAGDASGDLLSEQLHLGYTVSLVVALLVVLALLVGQFSTRQFNAPIFWALIFSTSTVGTELSDAMDRALNLGYVSGTLGFCACLLAVLAIWYLWSRPIPVYPIIARADVLFYWVAAMFANSLGSALGDLVGGPFGFGLIGAAAINACVLAFVILLHYGTRINKALLFWTAFVFARA